MFRKNMLAKNITLLVFSLLFYSWGEPIFVWIMIASIIVNYGLGVWIDLKREDKKESLLILTLMCVLNLGILFIFKYLSFSVGIVNGLLGAQMRIPQIALPIGISFFTFQAMSYVVDVYREDAKVQRNPFYLALYISFFPQLIAGPIVCYQTIADQLSNRVETPDKIAIGTCRFMTGFCKKVLISNNMAIIVDQIYGLNQLGGIPSTLAWMGAFAYTLQIFFDFSAYSDMAIGLGLIFGFKFEENFNYPYISKSITEFWRRWHISLGTWFRNYVYIPLGGSRTKNKDLMVRNVLIVWMCTGVWHGANWTFVIWGAYNFVFIFTEKLLDFDNLRIPKWMKHIYALLVINLGWVIFRSEDTLSCAYYIASMMGLLDGIWSNYTFMFFREYGLFMLVAIAFSMPIGKRMNKLVTDGSTVAAVLQYGYPIVVFVLFLASVSYLVVGSYNPFIYFNF